MAGQPDKPPEIAGLITGLLKGNQLVNKPLIRPAISGGGGVTLGGVGRLNSA